MNGYDYFNSKFTEAMVLHNGIDYWKEETHKIVDKKIKEVFSEIKKTAPESWPYDLNILLARLAAMNNDKKLGYKTLVSIKENGINDPLWNYLMGNCLYDGLPPQKEEAPKCYNKITQLLSYVDINIYKKYKYLNYFNFLYIVYPTTPIVFSYKLSFTLCCF